MPTLYLVTGNKGKLREWQRLCPADIALEAIDIDLDEIQSLDLEAIALDKAQRAFAAVGKPVLVEDVSAALDCLKGLPGPFIKYFEKALGNDALYKLADDDDNAAVVTCTIGYCDDSRSFTVSAAVTGKAVVPRGDGGFGFDKCFVPEGQPKTFGEMSDSEKDALSHRAAAIHELICQLG